MAKSNKLSAYILLDRSGSISGSRWEGAIGAINTYVHGLRTAGTDAEITLATFDSNGPSNWGGQVRLGGAQMARAFNAEVVDPNSFDVIRDKVSIKKFKDVGINETSPRGGTPLYDSTAKLLNLADKNNNEKTVIIIMTDGEENSSKTYNLASIRDRIATCQARGWEVLFLGAEFNADTVAQNYGLSAGKVINTSLRNMDATMNFYATASADYTVSGKAVDTRAVKASLAKE